MDITTVSTVQYVQIPFTMTIFLCPHCKQRVAAPAYGNQEYLCDDIVHKCNSPATVLNYDDDLKFGEYVDDDNDTIQVPNWNFQGMQNRFKGTMAGIGGARFDKVTKRGNNSYTTYQSQHYEYINLNGRRRD